MLKIDCKDVIYMLNYFNEKVHQCILKYDDYILNEYNIRINNIGFYVTNLIEYLELYLIVKKEMGI